MTTIVIDIETVADPKLANTFLEKHHDDIQAIYPEYATICCVSWLAIGKNGEEYTGSEYGPFEHDILEKMAPIFAKATKLVGHNIKGFDAPFLRKRYITNKMEVPNILKVYGKKPWEVPLDDTMEIRKGTGWKSTSLDTICKTLGIETPKGEVDGSMVGVLFEKGEFEKIKDYCEKDVYATYQVWKMLQNT